MSIDLSSSFDTVSLEELEKLARVISMESGVQANLTFDPKRRFDQFFTRASIFFKSVQIPVLNAVKLMSNDMNTLVARIGFVDAASKNVIVPEGFVGQWLPYSASLKENMNKAAKVEFMVRSLNETLGRLLNDPSQLKSLSGVGHQGPSTLGLDEGMRSLGTTYFDGRSNHITRTLGAVVERAADISAVHNNINDATAMDKSHPAKRALAAVERTMQLSDSLVPHVTGEAGVSKAVMQELIDLTLQIAREMEAYGVLLFRIRQFSEALKDSVKELKK
ncbi:hypothetical protein D9M68_17480 [compost metagenome]